MNDVIGWIMAWLTKGSENYCFEFFSEDAEYDPSEWAECNEAIWTEEMNGCTMKANQRAFAELDVLKNGKKNKYGMEVVAGYVVPVYGRLKARL